MQIFKEGFLLPNEPCLIQSRKDRKLSERHITPALSQIEAFLLFLRKDVDLRLQAAQAQKSGKPYPLGQCLEISLAMQERFKRMHRLQLDGVLAAGRQALVDFIQAGGAVRQIWGDLRGNYFQNAFQIGSYYVDVSNDTVTATKPKVEILPFNEAGISPIRSYEHYATIAQRYWKAKVLPNHIFPEIAPFAPLILILPGGRVRLKASSNYMLALVIREQFRISELVLDQMPLHRALFQDLQAYLPRHISFVATSPEHGRLLALNKCVQYRDDIVKKSHKEIESMMRAISNTIDGVNYHLSHFTLSDLQITSYELDTQRSNADDKQINASTAGRKEMKKIQIDEVQYDLQQFSNEAKTQLDLLMNTESKIAQLRKELLMMQAARNAFLSALKPLLPPPAQ